MKAISTIKVLVTFLAAATATTQNIAFSQIKLTPKNERSPFTGVPYAYGVADVKLDYNSARTTGKWKVCIETNVIGFIPDQLHIRKAQISLNGLIDKVDYSKMLRGEPTFKGCKNVDQAVYNDMKDNSEYFYVNAQVAESPESLRLRGIRGQFIQRLTTDVSADEEVGQYEQDLDASGTATISFEDGGTTICMDANITGFDPVASHFHNGPAGANGDLVADFSKFRVAPGRFLGCNTLSGLGIDDSDLASKVLDQPADFYIQFHLGKQGSRKFNTAIRGQFD